MLKRILMGLIILLIGVQFFQSQRNYTKEITPSHLERAYAVPAAVKALLVQSCYDCHSNQTNYPWYSVLQPASWYLDRHIRAGKKQLNFSHFGDYTVRKQRNMFRAMAGQVKQGEMPLSSYTLVHSQGALSEKQKMVLIEWFEQMED